jgi:hypothetical protein
MVEIGKKDGEAAISAGHGASFKKINKQYEDLQQ